MKRKVTINRRQPPRTINDMTVLSSFIFVSRLSLWNKEGRDLSYGHILLCLGREKDDRNGRTNLLFAAKRLGYNH